MIKVSDLYYNWNLDCDIKHEYFDYDVGRLMAEDTK